MLTPVPHLSAPVFIHVAPVLTDQQPHAWYEWIAEGFLYMHLKFLIHTPLHSDVTKKKSMGYHKNVIILLTISPSRGVIH